MDGVECVESVDGCGKAERVINAYIYRERDVYLCIVTRERTIFIISRERE